MKDCQEITELYERSKIDRITLGDRLSIRFHKAICKNCRHYFQDSELMDQMLSRRFRHMGKYSFSQEEKEKIKALLEKKSNS